MFWTFKTRAMKKRKEKKRNGRTKKRGEEANGPSPLTGHSTAHPGLSPSPTLTSGPHRVTPALTRASIDVRAIPPEITPPPLLYSSSTSTCARCCPPRNPKRAATPFPSSAAGHRESSTSGYASSAQEAVPESARTIAVLSAPSRVRFCLLREQGGSPAAARFHDRTAGRRLPFLR